MYFDNARMESFDAEVVEVFANVTEQDKRNLLILNKSAFYPTSGGQAHDVGTIQIEGIEQPFNVIDAIKVGKVTMHKLDREIDPDMEIKGKQVSGKIDMKRRS